MRSLLVITNADAGTSDEERLAEALVVLREKASVEVVALATAGLGVGDDEKGVHRVRVVVPPRTRTNPAQAVPVVA